jgi:nitroreductase/NAD-dependent dihydropyrimidine dehydrogenase PreA subunit
MDVCPAMIIDSDETTGIPILLKDKEAFCIDCFHCESVCPTGAFTHNRSKEKMLSKQTKPSELKAQDLSEYLQSRRSIRRYKQEKIRREIIEDALETVRYAPTGINRQLNHWVIVSDNRVLHQIAQSVIDWMKSLETVAPEKFNYFTPLIEAWGQGVDRITRSAPHLAFCCGPNEPISKTDADIAASHLEIIFPSLGIGSCWAGYIMMAFANNPKLKELIGLNEEMSVFSILMFGYPEYTYETIPARNPVSVDWL